MSRDVLDELKEDLERAAQDPQGADRNLVPIEKLQQLIDAIVYGSPDEVKRLMADPAYKQWTRRRAEARWRHSQVNEHSPD